MTPAPTTNRITTAAQLEAMPRDDFRYELVAGELRVLSPAGGRHGRVAMKLAQHLANHVDQFRLGRVYAAETGYVLARNPDTVRAPDVAFIAEARAAQIVDDSGFLPIPPDSVTEVLSPTDRFADVEAKVHDWLAAGTRLVLLVDPATRRVHAYRSADNIVALGLRDELEASDVVEGWRLPVAGLFVQVCSDI